MWQPARGLLDGDRSGALALLRVLLNDGPETLAARYRGTDAA